MNALERFMAYAEDFEKTYADDDWSRLAPHFNEDAIYEIVSDTMPCSLQGTAAIFAGIRKSLEGMDRRFEQRSIAPGDDLQFDDSSVSISWTATYSNPGQPPFVLKGKSQAELRNGKISLLRDSYAKTADEEMQQWIAETGMEIDPSYV